RVSASVGIAMFPSRDVRVRDALLKAADEALLQAKRDGGGRICVYQQQGVIYSPHVASPGRDAAPPPSAAPSGPPSGPPSARPSSPSRPTISRPPSRPSRPDEIFKKDEPKSFDRNLFKRDEPRSFDRDLFKLDEPKSFEKREAIFPKEESKSFEK